MKNSTFTLTWIIYLLSAFINLTGCNQQSTSNSNSEQVPLKAKLDVNQPIYTRQISNDYGAMACYSNVLASQEISHSPERMLDVALSVFGRSDKIKEIGCKELRGGIKVYFSEDQLTRLQKLISDDRVGFIFFQTSPDVLGLQVIFSGDLTNNPNGTNEIANQANLSDSTQGVNKNENPNIPKLALSFNRLQEAAKTPSSDVASEAASQQYMTSNPLAITDDAKPSFDCAKAKSTVELLICSDPALSRLDMELFNLFKEAKAKTADKENFKKQAIAEWKWREANCQDRECLLGWYQRRRDQLTSQEKG